MNWVIKHSSSGRYWGRDGWVEKIGQAIVFTTAQACSIAMPFEGEWQQKGKE